MAKYKWVLAGAITVFILLIVYYGQFMFNGNIAFTAWGDGFKNYYTLAYYLMYDNGAHLTGMNYPYDENVIYTDNQPLTAWLLKPFTTLFPALLNHVQSIIIWLLILGDLLCYYLLYKILCRFNLPDAFAVLFAIFITMLSPQLSRLNGHFSLGYTFLIPLLIWWLINLISTGYSIRYLVLLTLLLTGGIFIHPYHFAMAALFVISLSTVLFFRTNGGLIKKLTAFTPVIAIVVAFAVFKIYNVVTDPIADRPASPWGFVESRSTIADILLHNMAFTYQGIIGAFPNARIVFHGEGQAYIGVVAILALALLLLYAIIPPMRRQYQHLNIPPLVITLLLAGIPVLLFAMAFPFSINDWFHSLLIYTPSTIKQFRAAGRFSWIFYYTAGITAAVVAYRVYISIHIKPLAFLFLLAVSTFWFIDLNTTNIYNKQLILAYITPTNPQQDRREVAAGLSQYGYNANHFQAILPIPHYLNGSEKLYISSPALLSTMEISLASGLPIAACQMSRTSEEQTFKMVNLFGGGMIKKQILQLFNTKPLLGMVAGETMSAAEKQVIQKSKYLFTYDDVKYYEVPLSAFADSTAAIKQQVADTKSKLYNHGAYFSYDSLPTIVYKSFDDSPIGHAVFGKGALYSHQDDVWLYRDTLPNAADEKQYEISAWTYSDKRRAAFPLYVIKQIDSTGKEIEQFYSDPKFATQAYGSWVHTSAVFTLHNKANKLLISGTGNFATYDELMIRPVGSTVITHFSSNQSFTYNNFPIY